MYKKMKWVLNILTFYERCVILSPLCVKGEVAERGVRIGNGNQLFVFLDVQQRTYLLPTFL